jgi:c-di-GMP-binding flagellar brake protein YcgR
LVEQFRRTDPRYDRRLDVEILVGGKRLQGQSRNISLGGMFVELGETLSEQAVVEVRFQVPTQPEAITVGAEVRWIERIGGSDLVGVGIRFQGLRARDVWALNRYFQS